MSLARKNFDFGRKTATAGTAITQLIDARRNRYTRLVTLEYLPAATAHTLTTLIPLATTTLSAAVAAGAATGVLADDLNTLGVTVTADTSHYVVVEKPDRSCFLSTVSAYTAGTKTLVLADNAPAGGFAAGAKVWYMGAAADQASRQLDTVANTILQRDHSAFSGIVTTPNKDEPLLIHSGNASNAGVLVSGSGIYAEA